MHTLNNYLIILYISIYIFNKADDKSYFVFVYIFITYYKKSSIKGRLYK